MTAREKALEIFESFDNYVNMHDFFGDNIERQNKKHCALICVREIINSNPHSNPFNTDVESTMEYWQQVQKEVEEL